MAVPIREQPTVTLVREENDELEASVAWGNDGMRIEAKENRLLIQTTSTSHTFLFGERKAGSGVFISALGNSFLSTETTENDGTVKNTAYIVPSSVVEQAKAAFERGKTERVMPQLVQDEVQSVTEQTILELVRRPEISVLEKATHVLGEMGVTGAANKGALLFYTTVLQLVKVREEEFPANDEGGRQADADTRSRHARRINDPTPTDDPKNDPTKISTSVSVSQLPSPCPSPAASSQDAKREQTNISTSVSVSQLPSPCPSPASSSQDAKREQTNISTSVSVSQLPSPCPSPASSSQDAKREQTNISTSVSVSQCPSPSPSPTALAPSPTPYALPWYLFWCRDNNTLRLCERCHHGYDCIAGNCPYETECLGMCGRLCTCWSFVCGDCCFWPGCYQHDLYCRESFISWGCLFIFTFHCNGY